MIIHTDKLQPFLRSRKLLWLHNTLGLNFKLKLWAELSGTYEDAWPLPEANSTIVCNLYRLWAACPFLSVMVRSCHACLNLSHLRSGFLLGRRCALAVGPSSTARWYKTSLREIFKCAHLKFTVYGHKQAYTHFRNAVTPQQWFINRVTIILKPCAVRGRWHFLTPHLDGERRFVIILNFTAL